MIAVFCWSRIFCYKIKIGFFDPNIIENKWKNTCYKMNGWVFATDSFHNPFFNPKIRPWFWFVVCVGPPIMLWKLTGAGINILHKSQRSCSVSRPLILLCFYNDTVQHLSICEWTSLYTPRLIDIKPTEQGSLAVILCFGTLDRAISATHEFARKEVTFYPMIEFQHQEYPDHFVSLPASRQEWKMKSRIVNFSRTLQLSHAKLRNSKFDENQTVQRDSA